MITVWKFELEITDEQGIVMPSGAQILSVQCQGEKLCLWAQVNPDWDEAPAAGRLFFVVGTGNPIPEPPDGYQRSYIGTAQMFGGALVWHVYEVI